MKIQTTILGTLVATVRQILRSKPTGIFVKLENRLDVVLVACRPFSVTISYFLCPVVSKALIALMERSKRAPFRD